MAWNGEERRTGQDRRLVERRRTTGYNTHILIIIEGITWIDADGANRRHFIRRREDREKIARKITQIHTALTRRVCYHLHATCSRAVSYLRREAL